MVTTTARDIGAFLEEPARKDRIREIREIRDNKSAYFEAFSSTYVWHSACRAPISLTRIQTAAYSNLSRITERNNTEHSTAERGRDQCK
jgi:hypothetical protein